MSEPIIAYKGFDKDMKCRGFQFREGETYHENSAELCTRGFHACEMPLDVPGYYAPGDGSIYRKVEMEGVADERGADSKVCAKTIKIGAELGIAGLVKAQIEWVKKTIGFDGAIEAAKASKTNSAAGCRGAASATGNRGAASATGNQGAASATGYQGAASATGDQGAASATGYRGAASATGNQGAASATGDQGAASATGNRGAASATGYQGAASATGYQGAASATGKASAAMATGYEGRVMGEIGCAIFALERDKKTSEILSVAAAIVDGEKIKAKTWYRCIGGKFVEV